MVGSKFLSLIIAITTVNGHDENELLRLAASVEQASEHPLAAAIVKAAKERKLEIPKVMGFDAPSGKGAIGMVERKRIAIGNAKFLSELNIAVVSLDAQADALRRDGQAHRWPPDRSCRARHAGFDTGHLAR